MTLQPATRLGVYEVVALLGSGGMGEVYRARDTRLERTVAIKVLRDSHSDLQARFAREAKAIAALAHPYICTLFDIGHDQGTDYMVMELLEGETLAARLARGPLPIPQALHFSVQIASALDTAHRAGFVHRDLKPANVMLVKGDAKLLDFGLAKYGAGSAPSSAAADQTLAGAPEQGIATITTPGFILGTVQYMAPEQLEGRDADARTDVFAFGAVLYEMLTGTKAFAAATQASVIAAILDHEPTPVPIKRPSIPPALDRVVKKCLAKAPDDRWQSTSDLTSELRWIEEATCDAASQQAGGGSMTVQRRAPLKARLYIGAAALAAVVIGLLASVSYIRRAPVDAPEMRVQILVPAAGNLLTQFAISPDGRAVAFVATVEEKNQLWLRRLDSETLQPLAGTDNARRPFWSPDSRSIGFFADGQLKRIDVAGGTPVVLASSPSQFGGTWSVDGQILFIPQNSGPVYLIRAGGGDAVKRPVISLPQITGYRSPQFLPDGRHFLVLAMGSEHRGLYLGSLDSKDVRRLFDVESDAVFAPPDRVLYVRQGALVAQRLNMQTWESAGDPVPVSEAVLVDYDCGFCAAVSASAAGSLTYRSTGAKRQLVWVDRSGRELETVGAPDGATRGSFRQSPDGRTLAMIREVGEYQDIWLLEMVKGVLQRFTFGPANKLTPIWSHDGSRIVFTWDPKGILDLYEKPVNGSENGTLLWSSSEHKFAHDWSPDGRVILFESGSATTGRDLWALPLFGDKKPLEVAHTAFNETAGRFSPDGGWVAFQSNETGRFEIYVQPFPGPGGKKLITSSGGMSPQWRRDGRELFYMASGGSLMAVPISMNGSAIETGRPIALFTREFVQAISPDGQRFLVNKIVKEASPITLLLNWKPR